MIGQISKRWNPTGVRYRHSCVRTCLVIHVKDVIQKRKYKRPCVLGRHHQFLQHSFLHWSILSAVICQVSVVLILQLSPKATELRTSWLTNWQVKQILDVLSRTCRKPYRPRSKFFFKHAAFVTPDLTNSFYIRQRSKCEMKWGKDNAY